MFCCLSRVDGLNLERPFLLSFPRREVAVPLWRVTRSEIKWEVREHVIHSRHVDDSVDLVFLVYQVLTLVAMAVQIY